MAIVAPVLTLDDLEPTLVRGLKRQDYSRRPSIEGLRLVELRRFLEDGGSFCELMRLEKGLPEELADFEIAQINYSDLEPGAIKAWHLHFGQDDLWFVPPMHKLVAGLRDLRKRSPTCGNTVRMVLGDGKGQLLFIPRGVAHGVANLTVQRQILIYFVNRRFCPDDPDEHRLDPFAFGPEIWQMQAG
ncbi:MAG: dTDP-4-dehydrorhamnose 3,5-epimerase family protein [Candidatus Riflebacteria bacterium]|nr:dTDP-4-dehydrorhamnose 3,5-epimerase family protein [Candidatus Riflebacteria bacterium]